MHPICRLLATVLLGVALLGAPACSDDAASPTDPADPTPTSGAYPIVDTGQTACFDGQAEIAAPAAGEPYHGQDAQHAGHAPRYRDNGDGTVSDLVTGLMWQQAMTQLEWDQAAATADAATTGGHDDWRVPTIKELDSLILFTGNQGTGDPASPTPPADAVPFLDTTVFDFAYPTEGRYIDVQLLSSTVALGTIMHGGPAAFGLNVADGRIKAYPTAGTGADGLMDCRLVRGNPQYGVNDFHDLGDGTVGDRATGLMWSQMDSGDPALATWANAVGATDGALTWQQALAFAAAAEHAGHTDWRLPDAKELQSLVDATRAPDVTGSAAIDPVFATTAIVNEAGQTDWPFFWTSTTFEPGGDAVIVCFGRALGFVGGEFLDVHGAGCQRTDPKSGPASWGHGPQGDVRRGANYVRRVRTP